MNMTTLVTEPVQVTIHDKHNESQGVITCGLLKDYSEEDIAVGLSEQGVKRVYRIKKRTDRDHLESTSTLVLTFNKSTPPDRI